MAFFSAQINSEQELIDWPFKNEKENYGYLAQRASFKAALVEESQLYRKFFF